MKTIKNKMTTHAKLNLTCLFAKLKSLKLKNISVPWYVMFYAVTAYYASVLNLQILSHFYRILDDSDHVTFIFSLTPPLVLFSALCIVFLCFLFRYVFKTVLSVLIIVGAVTGHFAYRYGTIFDYDMMVNLLQTHTGEAKSYISFESVFNAVLFGIIPASLLCLVKIRWPKTILRGILGRVAIFAVAVLTLAGIGSLYYQNYASICRNNPILRKEISPYNFIWFGYKAVKDTYFPSRIEFQKLAGDSIIDNPGERPEIFVVVLGETARAQNFKHNGYQRDTTPFTESIENFTKFSPVQSCGTATAVSVPCMFSNMKRENYDENSAKNSSSLVDIIKYAGYDVVWYDNDGGCKGVCDRVPNEDLLISDPEFKGLCTTDSCYDEVLLKRLHTRVAKAARKQKSTVIFLHLIGSHGPTYFERLPDDKKVFKPSCERSDIENCSVEQIVNSYDNTIYYTDYILSKVVEELKTYEKNFGTAMFYISDHGESLGEKGLFLHGAPYAIAPDYQKEVPMMTWFADSFSEDHHMDLDCLKSEAKKERFSQDNFFHSLLGILDVNTSFYNEKLDLFSKCRVWNRTER